MTDDEAAFVEAMTHHLHGRGMPRMAARVWAWLLICDPPDQTAEDLAAALHASRGAISGAARDLAMIGIIRRAHRHGDRREYYAAPAGSIRRLMARMSSVLTEGREIADEGLAILADHPPETRARLEEFRHAYAYYEREWPAVVERYFRDRSHASNDVRERPARTAETVPA